MSTVTDFATSTFGRYRRELHRYLLRHLRQSQDVDDLAQEVYERICRIDEAKIIIIEKPLAYLYGIAAHVLAEYRQEIEMERRCDHIECDDDWANHPSCCLTDNIPDRLNLQQQLNKALAQLPPTHQAVLLAHKRDGLSYEECAEKLGLSIFTIEKYLTQAKSQLRTISWDRGPC
jgi:RNA polymerase sigma-70 factor (ECF subfamily)